MSSKNKLSSAQIKELIQQLSNRFHKNTNRHKGILWNDVESKLLINAEKLWSLSEMERTGGEPDVVDFDKNSHEFIFYDCSAESPTGRRSLCYDAEALAARKEHKPENSVLDLVDAWNIELLNEQQYRHLQKQGQFDAKTSSWIKTPDSIRKLGGALFADYRYGQVFIYHNGAQSYYAARGFRAMLRV